MCALWPVSDLCALRREGEEVCMCVHRGRGAFGDCLVLDMTHSGSASSTMILFGITLQSVTFQNRPKPTNIRILMKGRLMAGCWIRLQ